MPKKPQITVRKPPPAAGVPTLAEEAGLVLPPRARNASNGRNTRNAHVAAPRAAPAKAKATFHLSTAVVAEARAAVVALSGPPERLTLAALVERALRVELQRLAKAHNKGRPFPATVEALRVGRPLGG